MGLFAPGAPWVEAAEHVHVFKLAGEWVEDVPWTVHASDAELEQVVADVARRGMALAVEMGPLNPSPTCGEGIEGFATIRSGVSIARRIQQAGGTLRYVSFDEPFAFASLYDGPNACHWSPERVAQEVMRFEDAIRAVYPDVIFGDTEPMWSWVPDPVEHLERWMDAYQAAMGRPLAFLHLDQDFTRPDWAQETLELETYAREHSVEFGVIYLGDANSPSDEAWLSAAGERVIAYESLAGGRPDHVVFQSWYDHPDLVLPETQLYTFTWFIEAYFGDRSDLGYRTEGAGANLAHASQLRASRAMARFEAERAVDGSTETWWGSGAPPLQWIELDLGDAHTIAAINLLVSQYPPGDTIHRVLIRGPGTGEEYTLVHTFSGPTADLDWLSVPLSTPIEGIRFIRVQTTQSPSWVAWREIEVIAAE